MRGQSLLFRLLWIRTHRSFLLPRVFLTMQNYNTPRSKLWYRMSQLSLFPLRSQWFIHSSKWLVNQRGKKHRLSNERDLFLNSIDQSIKKRPEQNWLQEWNDELLNDHLNFTEERRDNQQAFLQRSRSVIIKRENIVQQHKFLEPTLRL